MVKRTKPRFWSHASQKHHLIARWSKRPIRNFRPCGSQNGEKILGRNFTRHCRKFPKRIRSAGVALCNQNAGMVLGTLHRVANITDFSVEVRNSENDPYFSRFLYRVLTFSDFLRFLQFFDFFQHFFFEYKYI